MITVWQDVTAAFRRLARHPGYSAATIAILALGITGVVAVYSIINAVNYRALPFPDADRIISLNETPPACDGCRAGGGGASYPVFESWRRGLTGVRAIGAHTYYESFTLIASDGGHRLHGSTTSAAVLSMLGFRAHVGRLFVTADEQLEAVPVALISQRLWVQRFGADSSVVGRTVLLNGTTRVVVGVMPSGVDYPYGSDVWIPLRSDQMSGSRSDRGLSVLALLEPQTAIPQVEAAARQLTSQLSYAEAGDSAWTAQAQPFRASIAEDYQGRYSLFLVTVCCVLLLVCANVGSMELARSGSRVREMSIRIAIGATRSRLIRQILFEVATVAFIAAVVATIVSVAVVRLLAAMYGDLPFWADASLDLRVVLVAVGVALMTALVTGVIPAALLTSGRRATAIRAGTGDRGYNPVRWQSIAIALQIAAATVLLAGATAAARNVVRLGADARGWVPVGMAVAELELLDSRYEGVGARAFISSAVDGIGKGPPRTVAAAATSTPSLPRSSVPGVVVQGSAQPIANVIWQIQGVSHTYFDVLKLPVVVGRSFTESEERTSAPVALVTESVAGRLWPNQPAVGKRIRTSSAPDAPWLTVVGVTASPRVPLGAGWTEARYVYVPILAWPSRSLLLYARDEGDGGIALAAIQRAVGSLDRAQPFDRIERVTDQFHNAGARRRFDGALLLAFSILGLGLAALGVATLVTQLVRLRKREIGIRLALGATRGQATAPFMSLTLRLILIGLSVGIAVSLAADKVVAALLRGYIAVEMFDVAGAALVMAVAAFGAGYLPARRASEDAPLAAIRAD